MSYIYQVSFDVPRERADLLGRGKSQLDRTMGYLNSLLPDFPGFLTSWGMYSLHLPDAVRVVYHSMWESWGDVEAHRLSAIEESKVFAEWTHIDVEDISVAIYTEAGSR